MKINTMLFIGGSANGRRIENDMRPEIEVPIFPKYAAVMQEEPVPLHSEVKREKYVREVIRIGYKDGADFIFYRLKTMTMQQALAALFAHYDPKKTV